MEFSWNSNAKCTEWPQYSIWTHPFLMFPPFQKSLNPQVTTNKLVNTFVYHPCPSRLTTGYRDTSFHISLNSFGFYLSPEYLLNFLWLVYSTMFGKKFLIYGDHLPRKCIESKVCIFTHAPVPQSKEFFENLFPQDERGEGNYDLLYFAEIWRWLATFVYLYFSWFVIFLNVMALQFCE